MNVPPIPIDNIVNGTLQAFKAARILAGPNGAGFAGAGLGTTYGKEDLAVCVQNRDHVPPQADGCGFYAWKDRNRAVDLLNDYPTLALLEVELWGKFEEFQAGYIAAAQLVRQVTLLPFCTLCLFGHEARPRPAVLLAPYPGDCERRLVPVCDEHADQDHDVITVGQLAQQLGVNVRFADDDDPLVDAAKLTARATYTRLPIPPTVRRLDDLLPGETVHVFQNTIAEDTDGSLWIHPLARLIQPLPGTDVPLRLNDDGEHEVLLDGLTDFTGWRPRKDKRRFALPLRARGQLPETGDHQGHEDATRAALPLESRTRSGDEDGVHTAHEASGEPPR